MNNKIIANQETMIDILSKMLVIQERAAQRDDARVTADESDVDDDADKKTTQKRQKTLES